MVGNIGHGYIQQARKCFFLSLGCFLVMGLLLCGESRRVQEILAARISPAVLRFHVLAESDGRRDQAVKLQVRSLLLDYVRERLPSAADREDTVQFVREHTEEMEAAADRYLRQQGMDYQARLEITSCYFPARAYGNFTFPCGYYDAVRVTLGSGRGHNWWCVMYPQFCFLDVDCEAGTAGPEDSPGPDALRSILETDDYAALEDSRPKIQVGFRLADVWRRGKNASVAVPSSHSSAAE